MLKKREKQVREIEKKTKQNGPRTNKTCESYKKKV